MAMKKLTTKKITSIIIIAIVAVSAVSVWLFYPKEVKADSFSDDFENGLGSWTTNSELPENPNNPGQNVTWMIEPTTNQSASGSHSVLLAIDGLQDDGAIWLQHKLSLQPNAAKNVNVTFQLWSPSESFNTIAVVIGYAGSKTPTSEGNFQVIDAANQVEGWKTYTFTSKVTADSNGNAYVALGIAVRWETAMAYYVDNVSITAN